MMGRVLILLLFAVSALGAEPVVVLLPLADVDGSLEAETTVMPLFEKQLVRRGWSIAPQEDVAAFLEQHRVRYMESLTNEIRGGLLQSFGASVIVHASILAYRGTANPVVALSARMIDGEGRVVWGNVAASSANATEGVLGLGRAGDARALAQSVAAELLEHLPRPGRDGRVESGPARLLGRPRTYRSAAHGRGERMRICVLPFASRDPVAGRVMAELLSIRLAASEEFDVVEPAEFRAAMRSENLRSVAEMTSAELARVGRHVGTTRFLRGNIHAFREGSGGRSEVQIDMNLADVGSGTILWAVTHQRRGSDYSGLLQRGTVESVVALADRVVSEAITAHRQAPLRSARNEKVIP